MNVYLVFIDENDYDVSEYLYDVYATKEKAESAIYAAAIENNEPALALEHYFDVDENAEIYYYPNQEDSRHYSIVEIAVK